MMQDDYNKFANLLMDSIVSNRVDVLNVLKRNGLVVGENTDDLTLFYVVMEAMAKSKSFQKDLSSALTVYLINNPNKKNEIMNNDSHFNVEGDTTLNATTPKPPSEWSFGKIFEKVTTLGNMGLQYQQTKTEEAKSKADIEKAKSDAIKAQSAVEISKTEGDTPAAKSYTTAYVLVGLVLLASIGGFVYLKSKNKV